MFLLFTSVIFGQYTSEHTGAHIDSVITGVEDMINGFDTDDSLHFGIVYAGENFYLPTTTGSDSGVFYVGTNRFIHNYADPTADGNNLFVGVGAGNFTMSPGGGATNLASFNVGVGSNVLSSNTTGRDNTGIGKNVLQGRYSTSASGVTSATRPSIWVAAKQYWPYDQLKNRLKADKRYY